MPAIKTAFQGYSVKFSPFEESKIAVATSQNFGIIGNGKQYVFQLNPNGTLSEFAVFDTADGLYDCAWSEENENILISASGDGSIKVWDLAAPPQANPLRSLEEHRHEVYSLHWNVVRRDCFLSGSWDDTIKLWNLNHPSSLRTFTEHTYCVYAAQWNPSAADIFLSASGDCTVKVWDVRQQHPTLSLAAHQNEVLTADWCKYNDCIIATGSVDKLIKVWDVRMTQKELAVLPGHGYAVRRVMFSPHAETVIASASYDMTVRLWDWSRPGDPLLKVWDHHSEFAVGLDWSVLSEGMLASCGWDEMTFVWPQQGDPRM
jgi:peroxin-7